MVQTLWICQGIKVAQIHLAIDDGNLKQHRRVGRRRIQHAVENRADQQRRQRLRRAHAHHQHHRQSKVRRYTGANIAAAASAPSYAHLLAAQSAAVDVVES